VKRFRAGISAVITLAVLFAPAESAIWADTGHSTCAVQQHVCGAIPHIAECCCRHSGRASEQNGSVPSTHRVDMRAALSLGEWAALPDATAEAIPDHAVRIPRGAPDLVVLFSNLRI
jgi:hypothetical protein